MRSAARIAIHQHAPALDPILNEGPAFFGVPIMHDTIQTAAGVASFSKKLHEMRLSSPSRLRKKLDRPGGLYWEVGGTAATPIGWSGPAPDSSGGFRVSVANPRRS